MRKKAEKDIEYVQAYVPDTAALADLVIKARGPERSMAEFARQCNVKAPSTFSRIVNELIDKPLSDKFIYAVAGNAADKQAVTVDKLMRANGKLPKEELAGGKVPTEENNKKLYESREEKKKLVREILLQDFFNKGIAVMVYPDLLASWKMPLSKHAIPRYSDFAIHLQGYDPLYWNFIVDFTDMGHVAMKSEGDKTKYLKESMRKHSYLFLRDAWEPETMADFKNTIVFIEANAFKVFTEMIKDIKLNTWMSVMYVDTEKKKVVREVELKKQLYEENSYGITTTC